MKSKNVCNFVKISKILMYILLHVFYMIFFVFHVESAEVAANRVDADKIDRVNKAEELKDKVDNIIKKQEDFLNQEIKIEEERIDNVYLDENCMDVKKININGNTVLSNKKINSVVNKYVNTCVDIKVVNNIVLDFYDLMRKEGYIYNKININYEKSSVKKGILVFDFEEAIVENLIYVKKNNNASVEKNVEKKLKLLTSFPSMVNEVLNINDIEDGIKKINRLKYLKVKYIISPGDKINYYVVSIVETDIKANIRLNITEDNDGGSSTNYFRTIFVMGVDDSLSLNDYMRFRVEKDTNFLDDKFRSNYEFSYYIAVPIRNVMFSYYVSSSYFFNNKNKDENFKADLYNDISNSLSLEFNVLKNKYYEFAFRVDVNYDINNTYSVYMDEKKFEDRVDFSNMLISLPTQIYTKWGVVFLQPTIYKGLKLFNSLNDEFSDSNNKAQFIAYKFYAFYNNDFILKDKTLNYSIVFDSQYTKDFLYSRDSFYIGDLYTVRGFKYYGRAGDGGFLIRNQTKMNLKDLLFLKSDYYKGYKFGIFYDYGYVYANTKPIKTGFLSGTGFIFDFMINKYIDGNITYGIPIHGKDTWDFRPEIYFKISGQM